MKKYKILFLCLAIWVLSGGTVTAFADNPSGPASVTENKDAATETGASDEGNSIPKDSYLKIMDESGTVLITDEHIISAKPERVSDYANAYGVDLSFTEEGSQLFAEATAANVGKHFSIVCGEQVYSQPLVREPITGGRCIIAGLPSYTDAAELAKHIKPSQQFDEGPGSGI